MIGDDDFLYLPDEVGRWTLEVLNTEAGLISYTATVEGAVFRAKVREDDDGRLQVASRRVVSDEYRDETHFDDLEDALNAMACIMHEIAPDGATATMRPDETDLQLGDFV